MRPIATAWCMEQSLNPRRVPQGPRRLFRQCVIALLVLATTHEQTRAQAAASPAYDVVIRGGRVLDGAGNPWIVTIDHGKHTGAKAGKVLYGPGHHAPSTMP